MKIIEKGHKYKLHTLDGEMDVTLTFVKRFRGVENHAGTINQEVLRCLIDRVVVLDSECRWEGNDKILYYLRMALILHEARAIERKVEKDELHPEDIVLCPKDGHIKLYLE